MVIKRGLHKFVKGTSGAATPVAPKFMFLGDFNLHLGSVETGAPQDFSKVSDKILQEMFIIHSGLDDITSK